MSPRTPLGRWLADARVVVLAYLAASVAFTWPLVGYQPLGYRERARHLLVPTREPDAAWEVLHAAGTTHVVLNRRAYHAADERAVADWLASRGARSVGEVGHTSLCELPPVSGRRPFDSPANDSLRALQAAGGRR
jgi:hypothetical protein